MEDILKVFFESKKIGWIESVRKGTNAVGVTFETLLGIKENSSPKADYDGIEIKTKCSKKYRSISLFSCWPFNYDDMDKFREIAGVGDKDIPNVKTLYMTINNSKIKFIDKNHYLKMFIDQNFGKISVAIIDKRTSKRIMEVFWITEQIEHRINEKCRKLVFIEAMKKTQNDKTYFKYSVVKFYKLKSLESFYNLLKKGVISIVFNIGVHKKGENYGLPYYHGITFSIDESNLDYLFNKIFEFD